MDDVILIKDTHLGETVTQTIVMAENSINCIVLNSGELDAKRCQF